LYNSISKGSANYIPDLREEIGGLSDVSIDVTLTLANALQARQTVLLLKKSGAAASVSETKITVSGSLGKILENCLDDAEHMYPFQLVECLQDAGQ
jgi:hypothetical protein